MYNLTFKGRFELEDPESFITKLKQLLSEEKVEYFGQVVTEDLGKYVDFQKAEVTTNE